MPRILLLKMRFGLLGALPSRGQCDVVFVPADGAVPATERAEAVVPDAHRMLVGA